jgi:DNA excision repair protein ERCC-2
LAKSVYRTARDGGCLMAQASTGIGKTLGTLFPMLKAAPGVLDKVFFLCAKTAGRQLALDALQRVRHSAPALPLRVLEIVAREQACEHPDKACNGASCPLAQGFYDRLPPARQALLENPQWDAPHVREAAAAHRVCPYFLAQELAKWADVAVGDYNYYFDGNAMLHGLAQANQWRVGVLVDEAHNLVDRARGMYSAELSQADLAAARRVAPASLRKPLDAIRRAWRQSIDAGSEGYVLLNQPPAALVTALQQGAAAIAEYYAQSAGARSAGSPAAGVQAGIFAPDDPGNSLQRFYFDALRLVRMAEQFGAHSLCDITVQETPSASRPNAAGARYPNAGERAMRAGPSLKRYATLSVRNVIPASFLAPRFAAARATVLFSATLDPWDYYRDTLGLPAACACLDVPPPFRADQLSVHVVRNVSTRYRDRTASLRPIVELMAQAYRERPGNYLSFSSSFEYSRQLAELFKASHPDIPVWEQSPGMSATQRDGFLAQFTPEGRGIAYAVLGGAFGEGIDLPGARLIGAFIVTLGLPQVNAVNEQMMQRLQQQFGQGYDYTYLYPGVRKVVQAAGRVIRGEDDYGSVYLIDDRYARAQVQRLLPRWWKIGSLSLARTA